jgi:hypothetical protein
MIVGILFLFVFFMEEKSLFLQECKCSSCAITMEEKGAKSAVFFQKIQIYLFMLNFLRKKDKKSVIFCIFAN